MAGVMAGATALISSVGSAVGAAAPYLAVAGTALSAVQGYQSAKSQEEAANYNAKVAETNARMTREQGLKAEELQRQQARQKQSRARAAAIESGSYSGTMLDVLSQSALGAELDALNTRYNYELRAQDYLSQAAMSKYEGRVAGQNARSGLIAGVINTATTAADAFNWGKEKNKSKLNENTRYVY